LHLNDPEQLDNLGHSLHCFAPGPGRLSFFVLAGDQEGSFLHALSVSEFLLLPVPVEFVELGVGHLEAVAELLLLLLGPVGVLQVLLFEARHHLVLLHLPTLLREHEGLVLARLREGRWEH